MKKNLLSLVLIPALMAGCSDNDKPQKPDSGVRTSWLDILQGAPQELPRITIQNLEGQPIAAAQVLIGSHAGALADNFLSTDNDGKIQIPSSWTGPEALTVDAPGYLRVTIFAMEPKAQTIQLRKAVGAQKTEVRGLTQGHQIVDRDGIVDFGLVIPALTKTDFLSFDINSVISSESDRITVAGQDMDVPSNVTLPRQKETYFIPLTLEKPIYRVYFPEKGSVERVFAAKGRFPFKSVVNQLRNGAKFHDVINEFNIISGAVRDIELKNASNALDLPTGELVFSEKRKVFAPAFAKDELLISVGISHQSGYLIPTDIKRFAPKGNMNLNTIAGTESSVLTVLKKTTEMEGSKPGADRISAALDELKTEAYPTLLPLMSNPTLVSASEVKVPSVAGIAGVNPLATYSTLSALTEKTVNGEKVISATPQWEIYAPKWVDSIKLPQWPHSGLTGKKRWQVALVGSSQASETNLGPSMVNDITHITNSSIDF